MLGIFCSGICPCGLIEDIRGYGGNGWVFEKNCRLLGCAMFCLVVLDIPLFSGIFPVWNGVSV